MRRHGSSDLLDQGRSRSRAGLAAALGASAAALASAGLVYWIGSGADPTLTRTARPPVYAPPEADAGQVVNAYEQVKEIYADGGAGGVAAFARRCARSLASDPGALDFCLAFDIYAAALIGDGEAARAWRATAADRDLALARAALGPSEDPIVRIAQIRELARQASLQDPDLPAAARKGSGPHRAKARHSAHAGHAVRRSAPAPAAPVVQLAAETAQPEEKPPAPQAQSAPVMASEARPRARPAAARKISVRPARPPAAADACRRKPTTGERTVCASPALRQADAQLQTAYRKALAAGASPQALAQDQARFRRAVNAAAPDRVAVERLYYQRTRSLEGFSSRSP